MPRSPVGLLVARPLAEAVLRHRYRREDRATYSDETLRLALHESEEEDPFDSVGSEWARSTTGGQVGARDRVKASRTSPWTPAASRFFVGSGAAVDCRVCLEHEQRGLDGV